MKKKFKSLRQNRHSENDSSKIEFWREIQTYWFLRTNYEERESEKGLVLVFSTLWDSDSRLEIYKSAKDLPYLSVLKEF